MGLAIVCWRCGEPGHGYTDCQRPAATTQKELGERIDDIVTRWDRGYGIPTALKKQFITAEIKALNPKKAKAK